MSILKNPPNEIEKVPVLIIGGSLVGLSAAAFLASHGVETRSDAILNEPDDSALAHTDPFKSRGQPGTRAPHLVIERDGDHKSSLDLYGPGFVLLCGPDAGDWVNASRRLASPALTVHQIDVLGGWRDPAKVFAKAHGISTTGAVLVRPDGFVAWRAKTAVPRPEQTLADVMEHLVPPPARSSVEP
jgi:hypothetical protein